MANIDRNYVLSMLAEAEQVEKQRTVFYRKRPYPAMIAIAEDRAYSLGLLVDAVSRGLLEQLAEEADREGQPTIHDVMTAAELDEADREAEARLDAEAEAWHAEGAPF